MGPVENYRSSMPEAVLHDWARDAQKEMDALRSRVAELEAENQNLRMLHDADAAAIGQMARKALKN